MEEWVTPHLTGGLGNRLFEFAAALGAAEQYKIPCVFVEELITRNDHGPVDSICKLYPQIPRISNKDQMSRTLEERRGGCFHYEAFPDEMPYPRLVVAGWRQTAKYFPKNTALLNPAWDVLLSRDNQEKLMKRYIQDKQKTWFLHVRLGDYKILPHHQIPILPYYSECLNQVQKGSKVILCSDEPQLCAQWVEAQCKGRGLEFDVCTEDNELATLFVMANCFGGAIVANSTFSWWGAYFCYLRLSEQEKKVYKAFYPDKWGQGLPPAVDVVPPFGTAVHIQM